MSVLDLAKMFLLSILERLALVSYVGSPGSHSPVSSEPNMPAGSAFNVSRDFVEVIYCIFCQRYCLWEKGINTLKFFPRCYYINDISEMLDFLEDFKYTQVIEISITIFL